jgi:hypothetical protein
LRASRSSARHSGQLATSRIFSDARGTAAGSVPTRSGCR